MPGITGMATTYNCPNFVGELFTATPDDTPFLSAIGGLTGGTPVKSTVFTWQADDKRKGADDRQRTEGADAPEATGVARTQGHNVVEVHQEKVEVSYTKLAAIGQVSPVTATATPLGLQPVQDELAWQLQSALRSKADDVEMSFISGTYAMPTDNASPRKTRGLVEAITTNVVDASGAAITEDLVLDLMQKVWESGGIGVSETRTVIVGAAAKRALTKLFIKDKGYREAERNVGGVNLQTFETDFGRCNIMLNRYAPAKTLIVASIDECRPAFLEIPGKGHFFAEPLAKTGARDAVQLYGEIGLIYGNEKHHGKLINLA
uniref:Major capsid protein n=1 Tax=Dulem virus 32 TaxID=3145750 RepID=A0AAU8B0R2_9CAUD